VAVRAQRVDQGGDRLGPVVAIDGPQVANRGAALLGGGLVGGDARRGALGAVRRHLLARGVEARRRAARRDQSAGQGPVGGQAVVDQLPQRALTKLVLACRHLVGGRAQERPQVRRRGGGGGGCHPGGPRGRGGGRRRGDLGLRARGQPAQQR